MGLAKYAEDNLEIYYDRMALREAWYETQIDISASVKSVNNPVKVSIDITAIRDKSSEVFKMKKILCADCGKEFKFTAKQQKRFKEFGFKEPKRCIACREIRKAFFDNNTRR